MYQQSSKCDFYRGVELQTSIDQHAMKYARYLAIKPDMVIKKHGSQPPKYKNQKQ